MSTHSTIPRSLYIHFPWCIKKCPYCDFNSHTLKAALNEACYVDALIDDFDADVTAYATKPPIHSIFMGGGTPSLFSPEQLQRLLSHINTKATLNEACEITMEANPGAIEHHQFDEYANAGINRISLGIQSFDPVLLKKIGRIHSAEESHHAIKALKSSPINNFNLDLMFGLPGQTPAQAIADCQQALSYAPNHLSLYQFTIEPNTYFAQFPPKQTDEDTLYAMHQSLLKLLENNGYTRYEVSAFTKNNQYCQHNLNYWQYGDYLGIGAGAHGKRTQGDQIIRTMKYKSPSHYLNARKEGQFNQQIDTTAHESRLFELLLNGLRLTNGININDACHRTGLTRDDIFRPLKPFQTQQLIEINETTIKCTPQGFWFINNILERLLPET